jgi:hypothetical protein
MPFLISLCMLTSKYSMMLTDGLLRQCCVTEVGRIFFVLGVGWNALYCIISSKWYSYDQHKTQHTMYVHTFIVYRFWIIRKYVIRKNTGYISHDEIVKKFLQLNFFFVQLISVHELNKICLICKKYICILSCLYLITHIFS